MHMQSYIRVLLDEVADNRRQGIARLSVRGGNRQRAFFLVGKLLSDLLDALDLAQDFTGGGDDALTRRCDAGQVFATARKYFNAQLVFQQTDLFADPRL